MSSVTPDELARVLRRAEASDPLAVKIRSAMELIEGVLDDLG